MSRVRLAPLELMRLFRLEDGSKWGDVATDVQHADARAIFVGDIMEPYHFITRARGYSKTSDLGAIALALLLTDAPAGSRSYAFAADRDQAALLVDVIAGFVRRHPSLTEMVDVQQWKVENRRSGATLECGAADAAGTWGLRPYFIVADELANWGTTGTPRRVWDAITSALPKTRGRLVVITTPSSPAHWAKKVRDHAHSDPMWRLSETFGSPPWMSTSLLEEQKRRLLPSMYERLFEGRWTSAEDSLVSEEDLRACVTLDGPQPRRPGHTYVIAVDVGLKRDRTVAVVCHGEPITKTVDSLGTEQLTGTRVVLDRIKVWSGNRKQPVRLADVEEYVGTAAVEYGATVFFDPWQSIGTKQRLEARGVRCTEFTFSATSVGRIASVLHRLLRDRLLALPDDDVLLDELRNVRLRETAPGVVRLDHDSDGHDDRAVALAMAAHRIVEDPAGPPAYAGFYDDDTPPWDVPEGDLRELEWTAAPLSKLTPGGRL
jgi:hypothetical protein